jgi:hypothetical protein
MKKCPKCNVDVDDNYEMCWNCQYSFIENRVVEQSEFANICPNCNIPIESNIEYCPKCNHNLNMKYDIQDEDIIYSDKKIDCLRCKIFMEYKGSRKFHEGTRVGALGDLAELFQHREVYYMYNCPQCGMIEFYLPLSEF